MALLIEGDGRLPVDPNSLYPVYVYGEPYNRDDLVPIKDPWAGGYESAEGSSATELAHGAEERFRSLEHSLGYGPTRSVLDV